VRRGDDFDPVSVFQFCSQGRELVVDSRRGAAVADVGMHGVREIHRRRAARIAMILPLGVNT